MGQQTYDRPRGNHTFVGCSLGDGVVAGRFAENIRPDGYVAQSLPNHGVERGGIALAGSILRRGHQVRSVDEELDDLRDGLRSGFDRTDEQPACVYRSEERRVGKECVSTWRFWGSAIN